ncbi:MFS transporter [Streptomyces piniterrae]|uniref:MFS transporter n=1 Tax=Streptomyces piniterrae TaxID=2571125 RepID=A0A4U0MLV8_9ACTN|nr:MFS transporter [Streptomyces piniterrae]TJZ41609.1 MFS transporter [Streptomyces piniterrae]
MRVRPPTAPLRLYLATAFLARLAEEGMAVAVVMLALHRTGGAAGGAFVLTAWMAPHVLAAPLVGALAARVQRPRLFYLCALGGFAAAIAALAGLIGRAPAPVALAVALAGGSCGPAVYGGLSSLIAGLVPEGAPRDRAYALDAAVYSAASVAGPAAVSIVAGVASPGPAMALLGVAAAGAAALATGLRYGVSGRASKGTASSSKGAGSSSKSAAPSPKGAGPSYATRPGRPASEPATLRADLVAGLTAIRRIRELRAITAATCLAYCGIGGLATTTVLLADQRGGPGYAGILMTAFAVGTLAGSLAVARWHPPVTAQLLAAGTLFGTGAALAAAALIPSTAAGLALFALAGLCEGPLLTATLRIRADHAPPRARAQVFTLGAGLKISAAACGAALVGAAAALPPPLLLLGIAALQLIAGLLYTLTRPRTDRAVPARQAADRTPETHRPTKL